MPSPFGHGKATKPVPGDRERTLWFESTSSQRSVAGISRPRWRAIGAEQRSYFDTGARRSATMLVVLEMQPGQRRKRTIAVVPEPSGDEGPS
jgi:hypothetical protein